MKKRSIFIVLAIISLIILTGLTIAATQKPTISILYMRHWIPAADNAVRERAEIWGAAHNVNIQFEQVSEKDFDFKITIATENRTGPDLVMFRTSQPILFQNSLTDVSDVAKSIIKRNGEFFPANKAQCFNGQRWVTIPWYTVFPTWMYRIDMLNEAGLKVPETFDDVLTVAKALNKQMQGVYGFGTALSRSRDGILFLQSVLWAYGSKLTTPDGKVVTFNSSETLAGLQYVVNLYQSKAMPQGVTGWDDSSNNKAWAAGQLAMTTNAPSIYAQSRTSDPALATNTGHAVWPKGPTGRAVMMDTYSLGVMNYSRNQKLTKELLAYITQDEGYRIFYTAGQGFQLPTLQPFAKMSIFEDPKLKPIVEMLPFGHCAGWPGPVTRAAAEVEAQGVMTDMVQRVLVDGLTPKAALDEATKRIEDIYGKYNQKK